MPHQTNVVSLCCLSTFRRQYSAAGLIPIADRLFGFCSSIVALAALRQKQAYEGELNRIAGTRLTLEAQVNAIETANLNAETMVAMKKGADALKGIHGNL
jgi:hypothetical protein